MREHRLSPEFLFVAACCRFPRIPACDEDLHRLAAATLDWRLVLRIARRQRVVGLVHNAISQAALSIRDDVARAMVSDARAIAGQNLALAVETVRVQRLFASAGLPVRVLKGAPLAQAAYGSLVLKHARDIDLLTSPDHALDAVRLLETDGYELRSPAMRLNERQRRAYIACGHQMELVRDAGPLRIELHWRACLNPHLLRGVDAFAARRDIHLPGIGDVAALNDDDMTAYLFVHGAMHYWFRLKWLADVNALLAARDAAAIEHVYRHAQQRGAGLCAGQSLMLCERLLGLALPAAVKSDIRGERRVGRLLNIAVTCMVGEDGATEPPRGPATTAGEVLRECLLGRGPGFLWAQFRLLMIGPADAIRWPLPRPLAFLYPLMRLPSWLWRRCGALGQP